MNGMLPGIGQVNVRKDIELFNGPMLGKTAGELVGDFAGRRISIYGEKVRILPRPDKQGK